MLVGSLNKIMRDLAASIRSIISSCFVMVYQDSCGHYGRRFEVYLYSIASFVQVFFVKRIMT